MSGGDMAPTAELIEETEALNARLIQAYLEDARLQGLTPKTIVDYESNLRIFADFLEKDVTAVTKDDLKAFLTHLKGERKVHPKTIARYFSALSSFYDFLAYEGWVDANPVLPLRRRYVSPLVKKHGKGGSRRQLITVEQARALVHSILDPRDRAINVLLAKTGMRRGELVLIDLEDVDWVEQSITLKPRAKRTNLRVFFDDEAARALRRWIRAREGWPKGDEDAERALFLNQRGGRLARSGVYDAVVKYAEPLGLHDPKSKDPGDRFTPHCYRHFVTTHLLRNGMSREYVKELRGDSRHEAIDLYNHIDPRDLRDAYLAAIPRLGL
jgi:integrase/recombinase XerD